MIARLTFDALWLCWRAPLLRQHPTCLLCCSCVFRRETCRFAPSASVFVSSCSAGEVAAVLLFKHPCHSPVPWRAQHPVSSESCCVSVGIGRPNVDSAGRQECLTVFALLHVIGLYRRPWLRGSASSSHLFRWQSLRTPEDRLKLLQYPFVQPLMAPLTREHTSAYTHLEMNANQPL